MAAAYAAAFAAIVCGVPVGRGGVLDWRGGVWDGRGGVPVGRGGVRLMGGGLGEGPRFMLLAAATSCCMRAAWSFPVK